MESTHYIPAYTAPDPPVRISIWQGKRMTFIKICKRTDTGQEHDLPAHRHVRTVECNMGRISSRNRWRENSNSNIVARTFRLGNGHHSARKFSDGRHSKRSRSGATLREMASLRRSASALGASCTTMSCMYRSRSFCSAAITARRRAHVCLLSCCTRIETLILTSMKLCSSRCRCCYYYH